jgi:hypothetical protein
LHDIGFLRLRPRRRAPARRLANDWHGRYAYRPLLLETFVRSQRYRGTCYRAANWILVGHTKGRGRMDRQFKTDVAKKAMLLYPRVKDDTAPRPSGLRLCATIDGTAVRSG